MKRIIMHVLLFALGALSLGAVLVFEIDGTPGFLLATLGVFLIGASLTLKLIVEFIVTNFLIP